ncbi:transposase [Paenibacillus ihuae]|uniref:transposase n=1 Tax=Paenibacillus ihuae TaxID=1232431 RepID=UPI000A3EA31A|nr:transposase [Paenibacillus ihuae]
MQIGTENQFILAYSAYQKPTDTRCLEPHLEIARRILGKLPQTIIADASYGSEENYAYLEKEEITAVVKYGSYHKEKAKLGKKMLVKSRIGRTTQPRITGRAQPRKRCISTEKARKH